jgi:LmbE family N-acetylglucosaminyl deacetylase
VLVVAAHPDDETIGVGATLAALASAGWEIRVLHVTDGAPRDPALRASLAELERNHASAIRRREVEAALSIAGLAPTLALLPHLDIADQEAALDMNGIARTLAKLLVHERFDVVITHPYEGGHPDHDASAFAVHAARELVAREHAREAPLLAEMTSYHASDGGLVTATFRALPRRSCRAEHAGQLSDAACSRRRAMLAAFESQRDVLRVFGDEREPLRCAPQYDFREAPEGPRHYESLPFGWTSERFSQLVKRAFAELGLTPCDTSSE